MSNQTFNIKKKGNYYYAYDTITKIMVGRIHITTGKFIGNTNSLVALNLHFAKKNDENADKKQVLIDKVIEHIKKDILDGDVEALDELLKAIPVENLKAYLPEIN